MRPIYHIVPASSWNELALEPYQHASLDTEGFIHCSYSNQVAGVANLFYGDEAELVVLCIDADRLGAIVREEVAPTGEIFPHVYGPISHEALLGARRLCRGADQRWVFIEDDV